MALQYSVALRNARANAIEATISTTPKLQIRDGAQPANCAAAASGVLLCEITLPSDWLDAAASGAVVKAGTWQGTAVAAGTAAHFRIVDSAGTTCHMQGSVTASGGGGQAIIDNTSIAIGQQVTVTAFTSTEGNA
jgi:hypothetical protein